MPKNIKVFHGLVNYGTQSGLFAKELRRQGVNAISVVYYDKSKRVTDVELVCSKEFVQKLFYNLWNYIRKIFWFFKYNTFHFYFGITLFPYQLDLPFYRFFGKKVVMEYLGNDIRNYKYIVSKYDLPKNHSFVKNIEKHDLKVSNRIQNEKKYIDLKIVCIPVFFEYARRYCYSIDDYLPLAIDISNIAYHGVKNKNTKKSINILHAPTKRDFKGTEYIENAIQQLIEEGYQIEFRIVEGVTHARLFGEYKECDIFIDQISTGWYGTAALESMAFGKPTCAFIDTQYLKYVDYADEIPVINVTRDNVTDKLRELIENREQLPEIGEKSRKFVEKYHDVEKVTRKLIDIYQNKVWKT